MKILIVNGHQTTSNGHKRFTDFVQLLKDVTPSPFNSIEGVKQIKIIDGFCT